jgi:hypothetical protein
MDQKRKEKNERKKLVPVSMCHKNSKGLFGKSSNSFGRVVILEE